MQLCYDRSQRPLEYWAAILSASRRAEAFGQHGLEAIIDTAVAHLNQSASPAVKSLSLYVLGKAILLMQDSYPTWSEWVACAAILSGEWAHDAGDALLIQRSEDLFTEYIRQLKRQ